MSWAWIAIRLTARSLLSEPSRSFTRAVGRPKPRWRAATSTATRSPSCASRARAGRDRELAAELLLVDRDEPAAAVGQRAEDAEHALLGAVDHLDDAAGVADRVVVLAGFLDAQQRAVADAGDFAGPRAARRRGCGSSAAGRAPPRPIRSGPRSARRRGRASVMSASTTGGRVPADAASCGGARPGPRRRARAACA